MLKRSFSVSPVFWKRRTSQSTKVGKELCAGIVGPLVAAPRPIATTDLAGKDLETELNSPRQSSAASSGGIGNPGPGVAGISSLAGKANRHRDRKVFRRLRSSILEISLHDDGRCVARTEGARRRIPRRRYLSQRDFSILARRRCVPRRS